MSTSVYQIRTWIPTIILAVIILGGVLIGATGVELYVVLGLVVLQLLVLIVPRLAHLVGKTLSGRD